MHPLLLLLLGMLIVVGAILWLRQHAFVALLAGGLTVAILTPPAAVERAARHQGASEQAAAAQAALHPAERVAAGFGRTAGQLGVMVVMASLIGAALLTSGGAERIVRSLLAAVGQARAGLAFLGGGFLLAIPVFFDTVFYLLVPLAKAARLRTGGHYVLYVLGIVAGGTMAHSLVPPTPGPLFAASALGVSLTAMIAAGCAIGTVSASAGYLFARLVDRRLTVPLREPPDRLAELDAISARPLGQLPPLWLSLLPILLPIALITLNSALAPTGLADASSAVHAIAWLGDRTVALVLAAVAAGGLMWRQVEGEAGRRAIAEAVESAGVIVLITGAGGAFGAALQQTGLGATLQDMTTAYDLPVLLLAWGLTLTVRTALGSATVAMITAAGVFGPLASAGGLGFHPVYLAMAIGCGSKPVWWMNDSGFWVITRMSGLTESEALRVLTPMSVVTGTSGLIATLLGAWLFPFS